MHTQSAAAWPAPHWSSGMGIAVLMKLMNHLYQQPAVSDARQKQRSALVAERAAEETGSPLRCAAENQHRDGLRRPPLEH